MFDESKLATSRRKKLLLWMMVLRRKLNKTLLIINIIVNAFIIASLVINFNVGIVFFLMNVYFMVILYLKYRKENLDEQNKLSS